MAKTRDPFWLEAGLLVATLVGGAVLRYWLSTVVPFDAGEVVQLEEATDPERSLRVPFVMLNGATLFALYALVRRSAGVGAAFAVELALQSSMTFQYEAMRIRLLSPVVLLVTVGLVYVRMTRAPQRLPERVNQALLALALLLGLRELHLLATLRPTLAQIRASTQADVESLAASFAACGEPREQTRASLHRCGVAWPKVRSLDQQEALWEHQRRLGSAAIGVSSREQLAALPEGDGLALFDAEGAGFILVPPGPLAQTARRMLATRR
ncbi:MAG: hypothetical protein IPI67_08875 [Myxococcales bacterium]|nr:hypothetical protein [Myxococcales bacterium]